MANFWLSRLHLNRRPDWASSLVSPPDPPQGQLVPAPRQRQPFDELVVPRQQPGGDERIDGEVPVPPEEVVLEQDGLVAEDVLVGQAVLVRLRGG